MGDVIISFGGGGGTTSDELTATRDDVIAGKTAVTSDSDDEAATGTMPDNGAVNKALKAGGSYTIPKGYHNGKGKVTADSLASQTGGATAVDNRVVAGHTYWKDGVLRTGNLVINSVVSFSVAAYSVSQVTATWQWPWAGPYSGVAIQYKEGGYPTSIWDGVRGYTGTGNNAALGGWSSVIIGGLVPGRTYYFRIWVYCSTSDGDMVSSGYRDAICAATANGQQTLISSGIWTVPSGVRSIQAFLVGGGGGGTSGDGEESPVISGHGGGGGYTLTTPWIAVTPGQQIAYSIGGGGAGGAGEDPDSGRPTFNVGGAGGNTVFGSYTANGAPKSNYLYHGGNGGSGGGGGQRGWDSSFWAGAGGSNGSNGGSSSGASSTSSGGSGQGTTTKPFGDVNGTPYGPGGGGGSNNSGGNPGAGGHLGGGAGGNRRNAGGNGTPNTGGGGGGGSMGMYSVSYWGGAGGSGLIIVRW